MRGGYDIYVVAHVEELKRERDYLEGRVEQLVGENAHLAAEVRRLREAARRKDPDYCYITD